MFLPYPGLKEGVVGSEGPYINVSGLNCVRVGTQVIRRGRRVQLPHGGILLTTLRVNGSNTRVRRCKGRPRVHRLFMVLRRRATRYDRRITSRRARLHLQILLLRYDRRVKNVRITKDFASGRMVLRVG